jgi:hypothetical protein
LRLFRLQKLAASCKIYTAAEFAALGKTPKTLFEIINLGQWQWHQNMTNYDQIGVNI